jgi:uncharacterized phage-associated protein
MAQLTQSFRFSQNPSRESKKRIDIPQENLEKFQQVFLYITQKLGAKPNIGKTALNKLLYFIDFDYYEIYEEQLMGLKYTKDKYGPCPSDFDTLTKAMENEGKIEITATKYFNRDQTKYLPRVEPDLTRLTAQEIKHIDSVLDKHSSRSAAELSDFSHKDIPWRIAKSGGVLEYESVFYRDESTSVRKYPDGI